MTTPRHHATASALVAIIAWGGCAPSASQRAGALVSFRSEAATGSPPGHAVEDGEHWYPALFHVHTSDSAWEYRRRQDHDPTAGYDAGRARQALRQAAAWGIKAFFIADHNSIAVVADRQTQQVARDLGVTLVPGSEWSLGGPLALNLPVTIGHGGPHLCLVGYEARRPRDVLAPADTRARATPELLQTVIDETRDRGGAVVLAHPEALNHDLPGKALVPADLVEVDGPFIDRPANARRRWHQWLMNGERIGAISSAGWHVGRYSLGAMGRVNLVRAPNRSPEALVEALRAGHVMLVDGPGRLPRVMLGADGDADGSFDDVREGDVLVPAAGADRVTFQVRVVGASGMALVLYGAGSRDPVLRMDVGAPEVVRAFSVALRPDRRTFIRAELYDADDLRVLTNPIYFDPARPGTASSAAGAPEPGVPYIVPVPGPAGESPGGGLQ